MDGFRWDLADVAFAGALVSAVALAYGLAARSTGQRTYRAACAVALGAAFILVWGNAALGVIGSEEHPANRMYWGVLVVAIAGAAIARGRAHGMARAMAATAAAQALPALVALAAGWDVPLLLTLFFMALWLASAWLFARAAGQAAPR